MNHLAKLTHYQEEVEKLANGESVVPRRIQIDPVAFCNHDCPFCTYRYTRDADMNALFDLKDIIQFPKMLEIFDDCVALGVKAVEITGGGEPSLHPHFSEMLTELNSRGLKIGLITNGSWRDNQFNRAIDELKKAEWVRFSLDAATPQTHRITHASKRGDFERAIKVIKALVGNEVTVGISFIVQKQNKHEIEAAHQLATELGVDYIRFGGVVFEGERIESIELSINEHQETAALIKTLQDSSTIEVVDNFTNRSCTEFVRYTPGDRCYYAYLANTIGADGRLYPCCIWKYRPKGVIADLNEMRLSEVWNSDIIDRFFGNFDISNNCTRCYLKDKNDFMHGITQITHVDFI